MGRSVLLLLAATASAFAPVRRLPSPALRVAGRAAPALRLDAAAQRRFEGVLGRVVGAGPARGPLRRLAAAVARRRGPLTTFLGRVVRVALRSLLWGAVVAPVVANAHPALAYVGYGREEVDVLRSESGSMGFVIPLSIAGVIVTTMRQGQRSKKEIKRIKKAYKKVQEEEAEYLKVDGEAESDADIMAQLRNRTTTMAEEEAAAEAAANAPPEPEAPPPPVKPKRMTMAEKIKAREAALGQNRTKLG